MAVTADQVKVILDAEVDGYNAEIKQSVSVFEASMTKMERAAVQTEKRVGAAMSRTARFTKNQALTIQYTVNDIISQLPTISSPADGLRILAQQGPQVTQAFGGLKGTLQALAPVAFSAGGAITAAGVALASAVFAADRLDASNKQLIVTTTGLGVRAGLTAADVKQLAAANTEAGNVSRTAAEKMAAAYISTGRIGAEVTGRLITITDDYARVTGVDATKAAEKLGEAFSDPIKGAELLHRQLGILTPENYRLIQSMVAAGDTMGAQRVLAESLTSSIANQANNISFLERTWRDLKNTISNAAAEARDFFNIEGGRGRGKPPSIPLSAVPGGSILEALGVGGNYLRDTLEARRQQRERDRASSPVGRQERSDALADAADRAVRDRGIRATEKLDQVLQRNQRRELLGNIDLLKTALREGSITADEAAAGIKKYRKELAELGKERAGPKPTKADEREALARREGRVGIPFPREVFDGSAPVDYGPNFTNETLTTADYEALSRIFISRGGLEAAARNGGADFKPAGQALTSASEDLKQYEDELYNGTYNSIYGGLEAAFNDGVPGVAEFLGNELKRAILQDVSATLANAVRGRDLSYGRGQDDGSLGSALLARGRKLFGRRVGGSMVGGVPYQINEGQPEVFVPPVSGQMVPAARLAKRSGTTVQQTLIQDFSGSLVAEDALASAYRYADKAAKKARVGATNDTLRRVPSTLAKDKKNRG